MRAYKPLLNDQARLDLLLVKESFGDITDHIVSFARSATSKDTAKKVAPLENVFIFKRYIKKVFRILRDAI